MKHPEIIVHVGMHKTGTTSIQKTLNQYLNDPNFIYVKLNNPNHSKEIFTLFEKKYHPGMKSISGKNLNKENKNTKRKLIESFQKHTAKKYIISGEAIRGMSPPALIRFKYFLEQYFYKITIVAYIRPPKAYMESASQQVIKNGIKDLDIDKLYPQYCKFKKFFKIFGEENIKLWKFDPKDLLHHDVVLDFCQRLNMQIYPKNIVKDNESISKEALSLLYIYKKKYGTDYMKDITNRKKNHLFIQALSHITGPKVKFGPKLINPILKRHSKDIEWMENILNESLKEDITHSKDNIQEEKDFLIVSKESISRLIEIIEKDNLTKKIPTHTTRDIADLVHILYTNL